MALCPARLPSSAGIPPAPSPGCSPAFPHDYFLLGFRGLELLPHALSIPGFNGFVFHH